ncbi:MAC/perforin domain protein (macronuclear) [Tetrahymena thermophila SB210]|uniref:MAC/perforin domain protein n=1 Tax=Tetrahymena thermophila (strain SB210) TaxID=312017 RepID=Q23JN4_TETTS|nr:MAC/perforin domain protein [Tetrahymena thermophila SB210]EAR96709.1 MAC/perforin domain protein [Tetrahymena thermophila SB210]|eukprot:XP_001016954.1 MAC/perforin domain protein [Tetrahymena thermophila SB210]
MLLKKTLICLSIFLILAQCQNLNGKRNMYKLLSSSNIEEAMQELCPFPGYHGTYCPQENVAFASYKRNLQSGIPKMPSGIGASFDISTGELKLPAIQLTYQSEPSQEQIYTDPFSSHQFIVADETSIEQINLDADIKVFKNEFELTNIWLDATQNGQWLGGEYSQSKDLNDVFNRFFTNNQYTSIAQQSKNVIRMTFKTDSLKLNRFAQRAIDALPEDYQVDVYNEFLNAWGTHISIDTFVGGMIEKQTVLKDCVFFTPQFTGGFSAEQVNEALRNELQGNPADGFFTARRQVALDHKFGGNPEDVANWEQTISQNPALLKINRILSWDNMAANPQVKANLQQAINNRIESMRQRQQSYQDQVREQRRIEKIQPRMAWAIGGNGYYPGQVPFPINISITRQFEMKAASVCPVGIDPTYADTYCVSGPINQAEDMLNEVRYERDQEGNYRTIMYNFLADFTGGPQEFVGEFVDRGCSVAQYYQDTKYTDFNLPPPNKTMFKMICTDCIPSVYNSPQGQVFQCSCPAF